MGSKIRAAFLIAACAALWTGCVSDERIADDWMAESTKGKASAPLGGEALSQRKLDLDRTYRDLGHFIRTIDALHRRNDRAGLVAFTEFADFYVGKHVIPMLEPSGRQPDDGIVTGGTQPADISRVNRRSR